MTTHARTITLIIIVFLFLSALLTAGIRNQVHVKLLAVTESVVENRTYGGSIADLYLDVKEGTGRVFIDTLPASKLDTQMSTRLARSIGCKYANADCSNLDFFYTIRANSAIVGGPSAGAATAVVTVAILRNLDLREDVAVTGTISSGGLIGPVGGLKDKITAASENSITTVLIPLGERMQRNKNSNRSNDSSRRNETKNLDEADASNDLVAYGKTLNLTVIEVGTLDEALYQFTGKSLLKRTANITINPSYAETMKMLSEQLCNRSSTLQTRLNKKLVDDITAAESIILAEQDNAENLTRLGRNAFDKGNYYSSASYCFGANVVYSRALLEAQKLSNRDLYNAMNQTKANIIHFNRNITGREVATITDLESYMVIKDRLIEANDHLNNAEEEMRKNRKQDAIRELSYANERFYSALSWSEFFTEQGKRFSINKEELQESCTSKLSEAEEFYQYIDLIFPRVLQEAREELDKASVDKERGNYELCLYKATIAKAQISMLSSLLGITEEQVDKLLDRKIAAAERAIAEEQEKDVFPILGYSYYEYAKSLRQSNKYSSLLYAEYALELSNLDIYFKAKKPFRLNIPREWLIIFVAGIVIGFLINDLVRLMTRKKEEEQVAKKHFIHGK